MIGGVARRGRPLFALLAGAPAMLALLLTLWLLLSSLHVGLGLIDLLPLAALLVLIANVLAASRTVA